jgi:hypothetical protein
MLQYYKKIRSDSIRGCEVAEELNILVNKMTNMWDENCRTSCHF